MVQALERQLAEVKARYHRAEPGWTYEDMKLAAERLLTARGMYEAASGPPVRSKPTTAQMALLLR